MLGYKTQMGTIFFDSSHFAAFRRGILQRQATVITTGPFPRLSPEKSAHFLWEMLVTAKPSGCPLDLSQEISPPPEISSRTERPSDNHQRVYIAARPLIVIRVGACAFSRFRKTLRGRNPFFFSAVKLNFPMNTLQWLAFDLA